MVAFSRFSVLARIRRDSFFRSRIESLIRALIVRPIFLPDWVDVRFAEADKGKAILYRVNVYFVGSREFFSVQKNIVRKRFKLNFTLAIVK
jgi:hypothetical protein